MKTRLTVVLTHPVQYFAPWFRHIAANEPQLALTVIYATQPTPAQQGVGFATAFEWDVPLLDGYDSIVARPADSRAQVGADSDGLDAGNIGALIDGTSADAVLIPGWHARVYRRAIAHCRQHQIPLLYRGDSTLSTFRSGLSKTAWHLHSAWRLSHYDAFLSVGVRSREFLIDRGAPSDAIFESPHAVDNAFFAAAAAPHQTAAGRQAARHSFGIAADAFVVLFAGKLEEKKRPLDAVRAAAAAGATLLVAGAGRLDAAVQAEADRSAAPVRIAGFLNQRAMARAYAAADCLVLPSDRRETWGLVVNEAMATGLPCVVADECGSAPDMVDDATGATFTTGDVDGLAEAIGRVAARRRDGHDYAARCRERARRYSFVEATEGLVNACRAVSSPSRRTAPRLTVWCGHFVNLGGMERITLEIVRLAVRAGGEAHCLVNRWDSDKIRAEAEAIGASWSAIYHHHPLSRRVWSPRKLAGMALDVAVSSLELLHTASRRRATHILMPDFIGAVRCSPALVWLRWRGVPTILRVANAPESSLFYRLLWRSAINVAISRFVCNSQFTMREVAHTGIAARKIAWIYNTPPARRSPAAALPPPCDVVYVGQLIPEKGVDVLLDAIALLRRQHRSITLNIVGPLDGWVAPRYRGYRESLIARSEQPDLAGAVRFLGWRDDVPAILRRARLHCCPSLAAQREAFGNVVIEAKAAGLPSVVSPWGALPELIAHRENGWICQGITPAILAEGLQYFLEDDERWRRAAAAARASLDRFGRAAFESAWGQVIGVGSPAPVVMDSCLDQGKTVAR